MLAIAAGAAFIGLFALWVIVPRFFIRRKQNESGVISPMMHDEALPQPSAAD